MKKILLALLLSLTLINATTLLTSNTYNVNQPITVNFKNFTNHNKDWIAIYPANSSTEWKNVIAWRWTDNQTNGTLKFNALPAGEYEVRGFYNNSYNAEATHAFSVTNQDGENPTLNSKKLFQQHEAINITFKNFTNHNKDWIGIYPANSSTAWKNVIAWHWTDNQSNGTLNFNALPAGEYEVRGFYNNSYNAEATHAFKIEQNSNNNPLTKIHNLIRKGNAHYIVVGDSTRASYDAPLITKQIKKSFRQYNLNVSLNAQGGYKVAQFLNPALNQYPHYKKVINLIQGNGSDTIIDISLGVNDIAQGTSSKRVESFLKKAIELIKEAKPQTTFLFTSPNAFLNNNTNTTKTITAYRNLSQELNIPFINFHDNIYVNYTRAEQKALYRDGIHYSKHGTEVQANYIVNQLRP